MPKKLLKIKDHAPGVAAAEPPTQILTRRSSNITVIQLNFYK